MDGTSSTATTLARWYKGAPLTLDQIVTGGVRTFSAESAITDSAPAATALATGNKSNSGYVGVLPYIVSSPSLEPIKEEDKLRPVANVLEGQNVLVVQLELLLHLKFSMLLRRDSRLTMSIASNLT
ncbi:alkaline phosphatase [Bacillus cereus]